MTHHLRQLGNQFKISLPLDEGGYLGRECPNADCERYFKIKPGTELTGENLPVHCPYCGHKGPKNHFHTKSQIEYATSVVGRQKLEAAVHDLRDMADDFNRRTRGNLLSLKMDVKSSPAPLRHYVERELETNVECDYCTLQYSVYGVFAFCPHCGQHNSLHILDKSLEVVEKMLGLAASAPPELAEKLVENAMEDCVSAFDGFGRELTRIHARKATNPAKAEKTSFQNLEGARQSMTALFNLDPAAGLSGDEWTTAVRGFQKRHLLSHKMGVMDDEYARKSGDMQAVVGRKASVRADEVRELVRIVRKLAQYTSSALRTE